MRELVLLAVGVMALVGCTTPLRFPDLAVSDVVMVEVGEGDSPACRR